MAPKRFKKGDTNEENREKYKKLALSDALCPICRSILIEPVTLPCSHGFCLACFNSTMENTALTCPLCRTRIGSWLRSARKENKIINNVLWSIIQIKFSNEINKKLKGDDVTPEEKVHVRLANPGDIRREYERQLQLERSEIEKRRATEAKASELVIKKILEEEQKAAQLEEEKLRLDEEVARRLAAEQQRAGPSSSHFQPTPQKSTKKSSLDKYLIALSKKKQDTESKSKTENDKTSNKNDNKSKTKNVTSPAKIEIVKPTVKNNTSILRQKVGVKQQCSKAYQHLLLTKTLHCQRATSTGSDSGDSIKQEMRYFKPIRIPPSSDNLAGTSSPLIKIPPLMAQSSSSIIIRSPQRNLLVRIGAHPGSAFVSCSRDTQKSTHKIKQPSVISDSGKIVKQYYNRKVNTLNRKCTVTSPVTSPCLGFETQSEQNYLTKMRDIIRTLSEHVDEHVVRSLDSTNVLKEVPHSLLSETRTSKRISISKKNLNLSPNKRVSEMSPKKSVDLSSKKILEVTPKKVVHISPKKIFEISPRKKLDLSPKKINGCADMNLQEKLDLEFARRLHEELNNPRNRQTRASNQPKKPAMKTRTSPRKRQITLDELMTPKKFKT